MDRHYVYMYDLPKVEEEKVVAPGKHETREFPTEAAAVAFMKESRGQWARMVLVRTTGAEQRALLRYRDGEIEPFASQQEAPAATKPVA